MLACRCDKGFPVGPVEIPTALAHFERGGTPCGVRVLSMLPTERDHEMKAVHPGTVKFFSLSNRGHTTWLIGSLSSVDDPSRRGLTPPGVHTHAYHSVEDATFAFSSFGICRHTLADTELCWVT